MIAIVASAGSACSPQRMHKPAWLFSESDARDYVKTALEDPSADARRAAIEHLGRTHFADHDIVIEACRIIAQSDASECVRCAAIRLLAESRRPVAADTSLDILRSSEGKGQSQHDDRVRLEAVRALYYLARNDAVAHDAQPTVADVGAKLLREDASRDVRIAAAMLLGELPSQTSLNALIGSLDDYDFGVVYHADRSLMLLTGVANAHDAGKWREWLASTNDPFARRGELDEQLYPAERKNWWQRMNASMKSMFTGQSRQPASGCFQSSDGRDVPSRRSG